MTTDPPALRRRDWEHSRVDRNQTRPEHAAAQLAAMAASVEAGDRLGTKQELRAGCGVSVGTFNEALRIVQARGLIRVRSGPGGGLFASRQSPLARLGDAMLTLDDDATSVVEAVRLRVALDPLVVRDALEHSSVRDSADLRGELDHVKVAVGAADVVAFVRADRALHARIAQISPNAMLRSFYLTLLDVIESYLLAEHAVDDKALPDYLHLRYALSAALVDAIADHDLRALDLIHGYDTKDPSVLRGARSEVASGADVHRD